MPEKISQKIQDIENLFPPDTAGSDMVTEIPVFFLGSRVSEVKDYLFSHSNEYETMHYLYIVDDESILKGVISLRELLQAKGAKKIDSHMIRDLITVEPLISTSQVAGIALRKQLKMLPIIDDKGHLLGAYTPDQLLDLLDEKLSQDLLRLSGITIKKKHFPFEIWKIAASRMPWILIGMIGGLLTGLVINIFKASLESVISLAIFIPVIMSTGATSANQSAMIFLRNLMHADIDGKRSYFFNELKVSSLLGIILGGIAFAIVAIWFQNMILALSVSISLFFSVIVAALIGVIVPFVLYRYKYDPAIGAGPFLTIIKDLVAMTIYFSIATLFIKYLS